MAKLILHLFGIFCLISCAVVSRSTASHNVEIELHSNSDRENKAKALLIQQINKYDLSKYTFTRKVFIQSGVIPHSHPVLTLNTRLINKPNYFLSTYLHEQLHWFFADKSRKDRVRQFVEKMKSFYPNAPVGSSNGGARSKYSTYLHLGVNLLEFDALRIFIGNRKAESVFQNKKIYKWINVTVLKDYLKIRKELDSLDLIIENKDSFKVYDDLLKYDEQFEQMKSKFSNTTIDLAKKSDVQKKLDFMVQLDQFVRSQISIPFERSYSENETEFFNKEFDKRFYSVDFENTQSLKEILKLYRWINISNFGEKADRDAWLIVQHADNDPSFQKSILRILDDLWLSNETNASNYAYLYDRVQASYSDLSKQKPQRYGTQGRCVGTGKWEPFPIEDIQNVDTRRAEVGLPSLEEYVSGFRDICK